MHSNAFPFEYLVFLLPLIFMAVVLTVIFMVSSRRRTKLVAMARALNLTYSDPMGEIAPGGYQAPGAAEPGFIKKLIAAFSNSWKMKGDYGSRKVSIKAVVRGSGKNKTVYTNILVPFDKPLDLGLRIYTENFFSKIGKNVFQTQDIQIGDPAIDELVMIKGSSESEIKSLLAGTQARGRARAIHGGQGVSHRG